MDKFVVYDELQAQIPRGEFYTLGSIPFKDSSYKIQFETTEANKQIFLDFNSQVYTLYTDKSGILEVNLVLQLGDNNIRFRYATETNWREFTITTTNIGTLHGGVANAFKTILDDEFSTWLQNTILNSSNLDSFEALSGVDIGDKYRLEEIFQSIYYWGSTLRGIRQTSAAIEDIPVSMRKIGNFVPGINTVENFFTDTGTIGTASGTDMGLTNITYTGTSTIIYLPLQLKEQQYGWWEFTSWIKSNVSGTVVLGLSVDGNSWDNMPSTALTVGDYAKFNWSYYGQTPMYAKIELSLSGSGVLYFAETQVTKDTWPITFPYTVGEWLGRRSMAVISYGS